MVLILNENKAKQIYNNYPKGHIIALTFGKDTALQINEDSKINYQSLNFLPDEDCINAVITGATKPSKVIHKAIKAINNPGTGDQSVGIGMVQLLGMATANRNSKHYTDTILILVSDTENHARNKFLTRYFKALFAAFSVKVGDYSTVKKVFKIKNSKNGKRAKKSIIKKNVKSLASFIEANPKYIGRGSSGADLNAIFRLNLIFYELEMYQTEARRILMNSAAVDSRGKLTNKVTTKLIQSLLQSYTNENMKKLDVVFNNYRKALKGKTNPKTVFKKMYKKNKQIFNAYTSFTSIMESVYADASADSNKRPKNFPKIKYGTTIKKKKSSNKIPKMSKKMTKKFVKRFDKNPDELALLCAHTIAILFGVEIGSAEYNKTITETGKLMGLSMKYFVSAAKAYAENPASDK